MIIYQSTKENFSNDVLSNDIENIIAGKIKDTVGRETATSELQAFANSLRYMDTVLQDRDIPEDCGISIEYHLPQTSKRVDFIITGNDGSNDNVVIIELKQWQKAALTNKDGIVNTHFKAGQSDTSHPSYQAWSYAALMYAFNATIEEEAIKLHPCAYLHNYQPDDVITNDFYSYYTEKAPVFLKPDAVKLRNFIKQFMKHGDKSNILFRIDNGKIKPTKSLADSLKSMMKGNKEFVMIDDQKVVYENAKALAKHSNSKNKNVLIVEGGPGTGKSVIAINLLVELNKRGFLSQYVTKTSAPRDVYFTKLKGDTKMVELKNLFVGSGSFISTPKDTFSTLIVDEAHRITEKTGFLRRGDNQIKEIINASTLSIFFIDENQQVHMDDYGRIDVIEQIATQLGASVHKMQLSSQFRCNGSDGYLAWLDNTLQIRETANYKFEAKEFGYEFKVVDSPAELRDIIFEKNKINNKARMVAGVCWEWVSKDDSSIDDIVFPEYSFSMKWNYASYQSGWIIDPNSVNEIGCIHTCQGLEVDYIGVIVGDDLIVRDGQVLVDPSRRAKDDGSVKGYKKMMREKPEEAKELIRTIIKNTYRTLMTRGMKGCYVYFTDKETKEYFQKTL